MRAFQHELGDKNEQGRLSQAVAMAPREDGQLFSKGMHSGITLRDPEVWL